jgi:hypothetical protein
MTLQSDWLTHVRRHLDRAQWHRDTTDDLDFARTELLGAIEDLWIAFDEIVKEQKDLRPIHLVDQHTYDGHETVCCGKYVRTYGPWREQTRTTIYPDRVTCKQSST